MYIMPTENELKKIGSYIVTCYATNYFPSSVFSFYENRRDYKDMHRTGIYSEDGTKIFFKVIKKCDRIDEDYITSTIEKGFSIANKLFELEFDNNILLLYEYLDTISLNSYNYLRNSHYTYYEKENSVICFFNLLFDQFTRTQCPGILDASYKSDMFFYGRFGENSRSADYYGINFKLLKKDVSQVFPQFNSKLEFLLKKINLLINTNYNTVLTYCHGDFHDFNFSLNGTFWDTDTFGYNPILNDFSIYYWHFYGREDFLISTYNPWLSIYMHNELQTCDLIKIRRLKKEIILAWFVEVIKLFTKNNITLDSIILELIFKIFCRVFLVDNVLLFSKEDRRIIYSYFDTLLSKIDASPGKILFSSSDDIGLIKKVD